MISQPMHFSLSLDLVSWRANLWAQQQRCPREKPVADDDPFALRKPATDETTKDDAADDPNNSPSRFVRQPVRVVFTRRRPRT